MLEFKRTISSMIMVLVYAPVLLGILCVFSLQAKPVVHVLFHMGAGANGQFFVGGTLENKGDEEVYKGFVVITPLTEDCYPKQPLLTSFGKIKPGEKQEFRIPIEGRLYGYKLDAVNAVDSFANKVAIVDETAEVIAEKQPQYLARCQTMRAELE